MCKKFIYFLFILSVTGYELHAQNMLYIDSLRSRMSYASIEQQVDILAEIGFAYRFSYPDSTIFYCKKAYRLGLENGYQNGLSKVLSFLGLAYAYKGDYAESFDYQRLAIENAAASKDTLQLAFGYNNLGRLFFDQGDLNRAFRNFTDALKLMELIEDEYGLSYVHRSLSSLYSSQNDHEKALESSIKALELRLRSGNSRAILSAYFELGLIYQKTELAQNAVSTLLKADSIAKSINDLTSQAEINMALAEIYLSNGDYNKSFTYIDEAYNHIKSLANERFLAQINLLKAKGYIERKQYDEAIFLLEELMKSKEINNNQALQKDVYLYLSRAERFKGNKSKSIDLENKYLVLKEQLQNIDLAREIERLEFQIEIERKEKEFEILRTNQENTIRQLETERQLRFALFIVLLLAIVLIFVITRNNKKKRIANEQVRNQRDQIQQQNGEIENQNRLISQQNDELKTQNQKLSEINNEKDTLMNIVAHDLKSPFHRLAGLMEILRMTEGIPTEARQILNMMTSVVKSGEELITDILDVNNLESERTTIKPSFIPLSSFIQEQMLKQKQIADIKKIKLNYRSSSPIFTMFTDPSLLGRVLDNLLSNAVKFSPMGGEVEVWITKDKDKVEIHIKDNGPGFTEKDKEMLFQKFKKLSAQPTGGESSHGLGLAIVKILTERLKGTVELFTKEGKGSHFVLTFQD